MPKKTYYKCGDNRRMIVIDSNELSLATYFVWKDTYGFDGDKSMCWDCYLKRRK